jgi:hypothetical protein
MNWDDRGHWGSREFLSSFDGFDTTLPDIQVPPKKPLAVLGSFFASDTTTTFLRAFQPPPLKLT